VGEDARAEASGEGSDWAFGCVFCWGEGEDVGWCGFIFEMVDQQRLLG